MGNDGDQMLDDGRAMRAKDARKMLGGIGKNTFYEWVRQGLIPHKRVGRIILFSRRRLQEWLDSNDNERGQQ